MEYCKVLCSSPDYALIIDLQMCDMSDAQIWTGPDCAHLFSELPLSLLTMS